MSVQTKSDDIFNLGAGARTSIKRAAESHTSTDVTESTKNGSQALSQKAEKKPTEKRVSKQCKEETVRFQTFLPKSLKRRLKHFAAEEDLTATSAMELLLTEALVARG